MTAENVRKLKKYLELSGHTSLFAHVHSDSFYRFDGECACRHVAFSTGGERVELKDLDDSVYELFVEDSIKSCRERIVDKMIEEWVNKSENN